MGEAVQILERTLARSRSREMRVEHLELALGDLYAKMNRLPEAEQAFRREIELFPANLTAYSNLGVVLVVQKKYEQIDPRLRADGAAESVAPRISGRCGDV